MNTQKHEIMVYFGRHKAASRYITRVLATVAKKLDLKMANVSANEDRSRDWIIGHLDPTIRIVRATPYPSDILRLLKKYEVPFKGVHVVRDPRDMIVSGYFSHYHSHPERWIFQKDHFAMLRSLPKREGLLAEIAYTGWLELDDMTRWDYADPNVLTVKFEDLTSDPLPTFTTMFKFCNVDVPDEMLSGCLNSINFAALSGGREKGETDETSHYRQGLAGDWQNHLDDDHLTVFHEKYGRLLGLLGYE